MYIKTRHKTHHLFFVYLNYCLITDNYKQFNLYSVIAHVCSVSVNVYAWCIFISDLYPCCDRHIHTREFLCIFIERYEWHFKLVSEIKFMTCSQHHHHPKMFLFSLQFSLSQ